MSTDTAFLMMGGSKLYNEQAIELKLINFFQLEFSESNNVEILNTLNVFSHGEKMESFWLGCCRSNEILYHCES